MLRRAALIAALVGSVLVLAEIGVRLVLPRVTSAGKSTADLQADLDRVAGPQSAEEPVRVPAEPPWALQNALHPYLGFVMEPRMRPDILGPVYAGAKINEWGFFGPTPVQQPTPGRVVIGLVGGSVAAELYLSARDRLVESLEATPAFAGREVEIVCLALRGLKQPQQLLAVQYVLAVGGHFDLLVALDGFNELALPLSENLPMGVALHYPRSWPAYARKGHDAEFQVLLLRTALLRRQRLEHAKTFRASGWSRSALALQLWAIQDARRQEELRNADQKMRTHYAGGTLRWLRESGPPESFATREEAIQRAVTLWRDSSLQLAKLAEANGIPFFHFLQPNQYFRTGRQFTDWERDNALGDSDSGYRKPAEEGFEALRDAGRTLAAAGVAYRDLTPIFDDEPETVYSDRCCHLNAYGYAQLAGAITDAIENSAKAVNGK